MIPVGFLYDPILNRYISRDVTPEQQKIVDDIHPRFGSALRISTPVASPFGLQHHAGTTAVDFVGVDDRYRPEVARAFFWCVKHHKGGVGIGINNADPHLHLDYDGEYYSDQNNIKQRRVWIEFDKGPLHEQNKWLCFQHQPTYNFFLATIKLLYKYSNESPSVVDPQADLLDRLKDIITDTTKLVQTVIVASSAFYIIRKLEDNKK